MKILVLTNLYPPHAIGGYEERCRDVVEGLREKGHEILVLTSTHGLNTEKNEENVHRRLWIHGFFGHPWRSIPSLFQLERHNHRVLREEMENFRPDVVHVWNMGGVSKSLLLTLQDSGLPVVYDVSDHWIAQSLRADVWLRWWNGETGGAGAKLLRGFLRDTGLARLIRRAAPFAPWDEIRFDHVYFCSDFLRQLTMKAGYQVRHGAVIYCGIETGHVGHVQIRHQSGNVVIVVPQRGQCRSHILQYHRLHPRHRFEGDLQRFRARFTVLDYENRPHGRNRYPTLCSVRK